jgi:7-keto-8-aminopelargonate synthetase-like enzyme
MIETSPPVQREVPPPPPVSELPAPVPVFDDSRDQWLLNNLRSLGYTILNPALVIANAREACRLLQQGESTAQMNQQMQARMGASTIDTLQLTSSAMLAYPNCY